MSEPTPLFDLIDAAEKATETPTPTWGTPFLEKPAFSTTSPEQRIKCSACGAVLAVTVYDGDTCYACYRSEHPEPPQKVKPKKARKGKK